MLSGHTDVVPVDGQAWTTDPWTLTEKADGHLYGRGTCDMKGFLALPGRVPAFQRARLKRRCTSPSPTTRRSAASARSAGRAAIASVPRPQAVIVGEPTIMGGSTRHNALGGISRHLHRR